MLEFLGSGKYLMLMSRKKIKVCSLSLYTLRNLTDSASEVSPEVDKKKKVMKAKDSAQSA